MLAPGMEPLWSPVVATGGNQRQIGRARKGRKQAETVAVRCDRLPRGVHGKEGSTVRVRRSFCAEMHSRELREAGEPDERIWTVAAWREAPYFTDAERAALALAEAATRLSDRSDPVPDEIWEEAAPLRRRCTRLARPIDYSHQRLEQAQRHNTPTSRLLELRDPSHAAGWTLTTHIARADVRHYSGSATSSLRDREFSVARENQGPAPLPYAPRRRFAKGPVRPQRTRKKGVPTPCHSQCRAHRALAARPGSCCRISAETRTYEDEGGIWRNMRWW
jgi:hypothetical protein